MTGTALDCRPSTTAARDDEQHVHNYSPQLQSSFRATATQHLLQGFGPWVNGRFIIQAKNDRRITDSSFRQQLLYTVNQVESIYWGLVSAYEDEQAKERALAQSTQLTSDNRKQLEIGTLAPLDVVNSDSAVATDKQALVASKSNLEYQQLIMKQAIARNLEDPRLSTCAGDSDGPGGPGPAAGRGHVAEDLVKLAYVNNPQIEQAVLNMKNNEITIKAFKNGLLPMVDAYAFYGSSALGGAQNPVLSCSTSVAGPSQPYPPGTVSGSRVWNSVRQSVQQHVAGQGRGCKYQHSAAQPRGAGGPGAVADGVSAVADAVAAALHADPHPGDQRAVCVDQRPGPGAGGAGGA